MTIGCALFGGFVLLALSRLACRRWAHCGRHGYGGWHGGGRRWGGGTWTSGRHFFLRGLAERLDATPEQERTIGDAIGEFRETVSRLRDEWKATRADVVSAFRKPNFDEVLLGELFARHDTAMDKVRKAFVGMTGKIHDTLDEGQRQRLADMLERGRFGWGW